MKKIGIIAVLALLSSSAFAKDVRPYFSYTASAQLPDKSRNVLEIQPLHEIVGEGGTKHTIEYGYQGIFEDVRLGSQLSYTPETKETYFGLKAHFDFDTSIDPNLKMYVISTMGVGGQNVGSRILSTNMTKVDYITTTNLNDLKTPSKIFFEQDPMFLSVGLGIGTEYKVGNFRLGVGYLFEPKYYQFAYRIEGKETILNSLVSTQFNHEFHTTLTYVF